MTHLRFFKTYLIAMILALLCAIGLGMCVTVVSPVQAFADGDGTTKDTPLYIDTTQPTTNPFPDKVTQEMIDAAAHPGKRPTPDNMLIYTELELKDGSVIPLAYTPNDIPQLDYDVFAQSKGQLARIHEYVVLLPTNYKETRSYWFVFGAGEWKADIWNSIAGYTPGLENGSIQGIPVSSVRHNGKLLPNNALYWKFDDMQNAQYFDVVYEIPAGITYLATKEVIGVVKTSGTGQRISYPFESKVNVTSTFHFVIEDAYHKASGLAPDALVPERSAGEPAFSAVPYQPLNLKDLTDPQVTKGYYNILPSDAKGLPDSYKMMPNVAVMLNKEGGTVKNRWVTPDKVEVGDTLPTLSSLESTEIPGYIYVANDVDTPPNPDSNAGYSSYLPEGQGNHYNTVSRDESGNLLRDKHYYFLYRPLPVPVVITKTITDSDTPVSGAHFSLMRVNDDKTTTEIAADLTTNEQGQIILGDVTEGISTLSYAELKEQAAVADAYHPDTQTYTINDKTYLTPGTYILHETKAPEGYISGEDVTFSVEALTDSVSVTTVGVTNDKAARQTVHYIDVHDSNKTSDFTPADGEEISDHALTFTGEANKPYDATDKAWDYASAGYFLAFEDEGTFKGDTLVDGDAYIYLKHATTTEQKTKTITRTINLVDETGKPLSVSGVSVQNPTKQTVTYTYTETTDKVTGKTTQSTPTSDANTWAAFSAPQVTGYTPTPATISQKTVAFGDADVDANIVYTKDTPTKFIPDNQQQQERQAKETNEAPSNVPNTGDEMPLGMIGLVGLCAFTGVLVAARKQ